MLPETPGEQHKVFWRASYLDEWPVVNPTWRSLSALTLHGAFGLSSKRQGHRGVHWDGGPMGLASFLSSHNEICGW